MSYLIAALLSAAVSFGAAWQIQNWRMDAHEKQAIAAAIVEQQAAHAEQQARTDAVISAQNDARKREVVLRADAGHARDALAGLRQSTADAMQAAGSTLNACLVVTSTAGELLNTSAGKYRDLAEDADRHVSDLKTLTDAWPR